MAESCACPGFSALPDQLEIRDFQWQDHETRAAAVGDVLPATFSATTDDKRRFGDPKSRVIKLERRFKERLAPVAVVSSWLVRPQLMSRSVV
jgi:hypothetical protein